MTTFKSIIGNKPVRIAAAMLIILALAVSCSKSSTGYNNNNNGGGGGPGANEVWMQNTAFDPANRTVSAGATVTWTNKDGTNHTATSGSPGSPNGIFDSGNMSQNATFTHTFSAAGTFPYYCRIHGAMMIGTITVH